VCRHIQRISFELVEELAAKLEFSKPSLKILISDACRTQHPPSMHSRKKGAVIPPNRGVVNPTLPYTDYRSPPQTIFLFSALERQIATATLTHGGIFTAATSPAGNPLEESFRLGEVPVRPADAVEGRLTISDWPAGSSPASRWRATQTRANLRASARSPACARAAGLSGSGADLSGSRFAANNRRYRVKAGPSTTTLTSILVSLLSMVHAWEGSGSGRLATPINAR
jgi:hypothetical protein